PEDLRKVRLAPEFQHYSFEDLLVLFSWIVAEPEGTGSVTGAGSVPHQHPTSNLQRPESMKIQDPRSREDPISKHQKPSRSQMRSSNLTLDLGSSLDVGCWSLDLGFVTPFL